MRSITPTMTANIRPVRRQRSAEQQKVLDLLMEEYGYWRRQDGDDGDLAIMQMGAMASLSNVIAKLVVGRTKARR